MALVALPMALVAPDAESTPRYSTQAPASTPSSSSFCCHHSTRVSFSIKAPTRGRTLQLPGSGLCSAASAQSCSQETAVEDWYQVLGVQRNATAKEVKAAYRQLVRRFHPDVVAEHDKQDSTSRFLQVHQAYAVLSDPQAKAAFDLQLAMHRFQSSGYSTSSCRQGFAGLSASFSGYAGSNSSSSSAGVPSNQAYSGYGYGYGYGYGASAVDNQGFTSYATASYPSVSTPCSQWKGKSWETDQCW